LVAPALDRLPQNLLGTAVRIAVGAVEHVEAGFEADVDQPRGLADVGRTPRIEEGAFAAERAGAETENGHPEPGRAKLTIFHDETLE